jgi:hypothetical protein
MSQKQRKPKTGKEKSQDQESQKVSSDSNVAKRTGRTGKDKNNSSSEEEEEEKKENLREDTPGSNQAKRLIEYREFYESLKAKSLSDEDIAELDVRPTGTIFTVSDGFPDREPALSVTVGINKLKRDLKIRATTKRDVEKKTEKVYHDPHDYEDIVMWLIDFRIQLKTFDPSVDHNVFENCQSRNNLSNDDC